MGESLEGDGDSVLREVVVEGVREVLCTKTCGREMRNIGAKRFGRDDKIWTSVHGSTLRGSLSSVLVNICLV